MTASHTPAVVPAEGDAPPLAGDAHLLRRILDAVDAGVVLVDAQGVVRYTNFTLYRMSGPGVRRGAWWGQGIRALTANWEFFTGAEWGMVRPVVAVRETLQPLSGVFGRVPQPDGTYRWFTLSYEPIIRGDALEYVVITAIEVTTWVGREASVRGQLAQVQLLMEQAPLGVCLLHPDGTIEQANARFRELFGGGLAATAPHVASLPPALAAAVASRLPGIAANAGGTGSDTEEITATDAAGQSVRLRVTFGELTGADGGPRTALFVSDIVPRTPTERHLVRLALHDGLTGLSNRLLFGERLVRTLDAAWTAAVLFLDLDGFKQVNDTHGHDAGDAVLRVLAGRFRACVPDAGDIGRRGGDEFVVLMPAIGAAGEAAHLARRLIAACAAPIPVRGGAVRVGVSVGIALYPLDGADAEAMIAAADRAMYRAKRRGTNTYAFAQHEGDA